MSIFLLFLVWDSWSIVIAGAILSSSRIFFSSTFVPLLMTTGSRLKCSAAFLKERFTGMGDEAE